MILGSACPGKLVTSPWCRWNSETMQLLLIGMSTHLVSFTSVGGVCVTSSRNTSCTVRLNVFSIFCLPGILASNHTKTVTTPSICSALLSLYWWTRMGSFCYPNCLHISGSPKASRTWVVKCIQLSNFPWWSSMVLLLSASLVLVNNIHRSSSTIYKRNYTTQFTEAVSHPRHFHRL